MDWVKEEGKTKTQIMNETMLTEAVGHKDMGDHVWVAKLNNRGTSLICYGIGKVDDDWHWKLITEDMGPDVYDCPIWLLDMCVVRNAEWRRQVIEWHRQDSEKRAQSKK